MMDNRQLLESLKIDTRKIRGSGKTTCPKCSHLRKNKNDPCLSVDINMGTYKCHNNCGFQGGVKIFEPKKTDYKLPNPVSQKVLSDKLINWFFNERGISSKTLGLARVTESIEFMPQTNKKENTINFNYFRDDKLINIKYRDARKNFKLVKEAELIFYGMDDIKNSDWCIIVEGEIDKLSFLEVGIKEVVSVPNGATKSTNYNLDYLDNCIDAFDDKKKIILAMDTDEVGVVFRDEFARRLGFERCYKVDFEGCKDANEFLVKNGNRLSSRILDENIKPFPISGIVDIDNLWADVEDQFKNGIVQGETTGKISELDKKFSVFLGQLMVITGIPNHGKSPFALFVMVCLSIRYGWRWALFTPEHHPLTIFIVRLCELLLGKQAKPIVGFSDSEKQLAKSFISEHFYFIQPEDDDLCLDNILDKAKILVKSKGIKGFLLDPWNKLEHNLKSGDTEHNYISREMDKITKFSERSLVFSIVIVHPKKMPKQKNSNMFEVPTLYDISGSSNWYNKPQIGVTFYRNFETGNSEIHIKKMKYSHQGEVSVVIVKYNINNGRFIGVNSEWDNTNWLDRVFQADINYEESVNIQEQEITTDQIDELPF